MELAKKWNLSYICWNLADKNETSSVLKPGCTKVSRWTEEDLSESGQWIRRQLRGEHD